jgi:nitrilase
MRAAVVQIKGDAGIQGNLDVAQRLLQKAAAEGAKLAVLPENFAYLHQKPLADVSATEETEAGTVRTFVSRQAKALGIWVVAGTIPVADSTSGEISSSQSRRKKPYAASILYSPEGREIARYNKMHLFDVDVEESGRSYRESDDYVAGDSAITEDIKVEDEICRLGLSVCYDLRFPELYRRLVSAGAQVLAAPSAFTATTGKAHWQLLLRARAVENLCFVLGANIADRNHPKNPTWGGSEIIDPRGTVLAELDDEEGIAIADLDFEKQRKLRLNMPALEHRRIFDL